MFKSVKVKKALQHSRATCRYQNSIMLAALCLCSAPALATDLEIYSAANGAGTPVVTLMLDISGSMTFFDDPRGINNNNNRSICGDGSQPKSKEADSKYKFPRKYCLHNGNEYYSRIDNLKMGVVDLLNSSDLQDKIIIGVGVYPTQRNQSNGKILIPAQLLTKENRSSIIDEINKIKATGGTPIPQAYGEVGAYMMGTNTLVSEANLQRHSGFNKSVSSSNNGMNYYSPLANLNNECPAGAGIYFLTDGEPSPTLTNSKIAKAIMGQSLVPANGGAKSLDVVCEAGRPGTSDLGWNCTLDYARKLLDKNNPIGKVIKTATVGYGGSYQQLKNVTKIEDCALAGDNKNARNLCEWGFVGEGGFYYAKDSSSIVSSINSLVDKLGGEVDPVSTGNMAVPLDVFGSFKSRNLAYVPILEPIPGSLKLWRGNLKKYYVKDATLKGANDSLVFKNESGQFSENTYDLWNTIKESTRYETDADGKDVDDIPNDALIPDSAFPQVGGVFQKIFENSNSSEQGSRNLFVNSGNRLVNLKVEGNKPVNFDSNQLPNYNNTDKLRLLTFMGYSLTEDSTVESDTDLTGKFNKWSKRIGGVLHSTPKLITTQISVDKEGSYEQNTRKDYLLFGSMDGALHLIDDANGKEIFTFIPKQILDLQPEALTTDGSTVAGRYPYGVDAPWQTYVSYKSTTNLTKDIKSKNYEANQIFAMGGLRMGGSTYYALDMSNIHNPRMLYTVGSTYSNNLEGIAADVTGITNQTDVEEKNAFARMGQTWAQPSIGYVKNNGKRVMVNFLPGGYDECYESSTFTLNSNNNANVQCNGKAQAQGNAMYMVQVGHKEKADDAKFSTSNSGKLLWWASNQGSGGDATRRQTGLQYSQVGDLKHSIVTQVRVLDRNNDGLTDHIYFADLGGQVWRADINNNKDTDNFKIDRVVKLLDVSSQASNTDAPPRFYERPLVTFYYDSYAYSVGGTKGSYNGVMAMVTVGTGDRSNPVTAKRNTPDAIYNFIDKDVTRADLFDYKSPAKINSNSGLRTTKLTATNLRELTFTDTDVGAKGIKVAMRKNLKQGWYMPLSYWLGNKETNTSHSIKMMNEPDALGGILITSSYSPAHGAVINKCGAGVVGSTQRERMCLPYGVCDDKKTNPAAVFGGLGIADNFIVQYNTAPLFTSLKNYCTGDDCKPKILCKGDSCEDKYKDYNICNGANCGPDFAIHTDEVINPLSWMER